MDRTMSFDEKQIDVICQHTRESKIIPLRIRLQDEDGEFHNYNIKEYKDTIAEYLSRAMYYEECYIKTFTEVGWDIWDDRDIFKYNKISSSDNEVEVCLDDTLTDEEKKNAPKVKVLRPIRGKNIAEV